MMSKEQLIKRVNKILEKPLEYYTTSNTESIRGLMEAMLAISIEDKPLTELEENLTELMVLVQQSKSYTIRQLSLHMWVTIGQYYMFLEDIKKNNYKDINLLGE
ncbi:hypothetical protein HUE87_04015 [Candidatus Sulfurimonas marisnigri]|uniref:Uncharacterized protein n=1 Tax=Candidatus Sulfurimonas marisnigri TaxID=2740405 RepID=A0A7S7M1K8_9BACT|nr:hypothetical protein [Candidatus Sulfurimonas marisnigri]QOY55411.1 hypothetical protein HUE87_04015 [Candidatus Sulfurimonas marisnigri]